MKAFNVFVITLVFALNASAADVLTEKLQRGLFEEEANHNLDAAIKEYQSVVAQSDEQRKVIATALFRLGECYRKLGRTNEANAQYQRILRDFSEQEQLVTVIQASRIIPRRAEVGAVPGRSSDLEREEARLFAELTQANSHLNALNRMQREKQFDAAAQLSNDKNLATLQEQLRAAEQKLANLGADLGPGHPEMQRLTALRQTIVQQRDEVLTGLIMAQKNRTTALMNDLDTVRNQLQRSAPTLTQFEAEQLASARALAQNSPDLLHRGMLQGAAQQGFVHVVRFLLEQGVSPDGGGGEPPLYLAARQGHKGVVELLLEKGAKPDAVATSFGTTALMAAAENGYASVVEALVKGGADVNFTTDVSFGSTPGPTALHRAVQNGHRRIIELLISKGAKLNILGGSCNGCPSSWREGVSPLHIAAGDRPELIELLLKAGAHAKFTNFANQQPLSLAVSGRRSDAAVELLLKNGSDPNLYGANGLNPLFIAILNHRSNAVALLLQHGADANARTREPANDWGTPAIMRATTVGVLRQLIQAGADVNATNRGGYPAVAQFVGNPEWATALLERGANPNVVFGEQTTPLHTAVHSLRPESVEVLLKHGANPNVLDAKENSPLSIAENYANGSLTSGSTEGERARTRDKAKTIVALLKQHGANDFLRRAQSISWSRDGKRAETVFSRGTNDWNRYTLLELLAANFGTYPWADWTNAYLERVAGRSLTNVTVNLAALFDSGNCSNDLWLEWGDRLLLPELDHPLTAPAPPLPKSAPTMLDRCLPRPGRSRVKGATNEVRLSSHAANLFQVTPPRTPSFTGGVPVGQPRQSEQGRPIVLQTFRLKEVVYGSGLLRASSDVTRVRVTRAAKVWTINLQTVAFRNERSSAMLPAEHDLWLRDGDVIEIPEKQ